MEQSICNSKMYLCPCISLQWWEKINASMTSQYFGYLSSETYRSSCIKWFSDLLIKKTRKTRKEASWQKSVEANCRSSVLGNVKKKGPLLPSWQYCSYDSREKIFQWSPFYSWTLYLKPRLVDTPAAICTGACAPKNVWKKVQEIQCFVSLLTKMDYPKTYWLALA